MARGAATASRERRASVFREIEPLLALVMGALRGRPDAPLSCTLEAHGERVKVAAEPMAALPLFELGEHEGYEESAAAHPGRRWTEIHWDEQDLLLGFAFSRPFGASARVCLIVGGDRGSTHTVRVAPDSGLSFPLRGRFPLPTVAIQFQHMIVSVSPPEAAEFMVRVVARVDEETRAQMAAEGFMTVDGADVIDTSGGVLRVQSRERSASFWLPDLTEAVRGEGPMTEA